MNASRLAAWNAAKDLCFAAKRLEARKRYQLENGDLPWFEYEPYLKRYREAEAAWFALPEPDSPETPL